MIEDKKSKSNDSSKSSDDSGQNPITSWGSDSGEVQSYNPITGQGDEDSSGSDKD